MIVAVHCCKVVRRTESGLQAHPHISLNLPHFFVRSCPNPAHILVHWLRFHDASHAIPKLSHKWLLAAHALQAHITRCDGEKIRSAF
jgi:hypothetical protein